MLSTLLAVALAQGLPIKDGVSSSLLEVNNGKAKVLVYGPDGGFPPLADKNGDLLELAEDGRVDIGRDTPLFRDVFQGTAVSAHNKWLQSILTMTATVGSGALTLNASAITTINTYANFTTPAKFRGYADGALYWHGRIRPNNLPQTNAVAEVGLGNALTNAAPTDGAFFRWTSSGGFECVLNRGGAESSASLTAPTAGVYSLFSIKVDADSLKCSWYTPSSGASASVTVTLDSGAPGAFNESPGVLLRVYNGAVAPALAPQLVIGLVDLTMKVIDQNRLNATVNSVNGQQGVFTPTTGAQSTNYANSAAPASATLSNTAAGYTTLGGKYQFAAVAGAATDYALFGYQVPTSFRLIVRGIRISTCNTVVAVATTAHVFEWGAGVQSTAVSLATADATGASPTTAPRRIALGMQSLPVGAAVGQCASDIVVDLGDSPLVVDSGRFFHIILSMPVATATATQVIRGTVTISGYFEQ